MAIVIIICILLLFFCGGNNKEHTHTAENKKHYNNTEPYDESWGKYEGNGSHEFRGDYIDPFL